ncbi:MAG: hypothetical protein ACK5JC_08990 [Bacteroidota bacterium]|jgi:hypothetical protein
MKNLIFYLLVFVSPFGFAQNTGEIKKSTAEVEQVEGMFVFYRSKPLTEYQYLGTYKIALIWDDKPRLLFDKLVRKTKEKFPTANGMIIDNNMAKCDAILLK